MPRVMHFEIHVADPQRAIEFYSNVLGWTFTRWGEMDYWLVTTGPSSEPGINGGMMPRHGGIDGTAIISYVCTADVDDLDARIEKALDNSGEVVLPRMAVKGIGWLAYVKDTEGNIFGMMQHDPTAA